MDDEAFVLYLLRNTFHKVQSSTMDTEFGINLPERILYLNKGEKTGAFTRQSKNGTDPTKAGTVPTAFAKKQARFTRQLFWHSTRLNLAPVPKIFGPAPSIFVV